jgi:RHS repeat-associated protein
VAAGDKHSLAQRSDGSNWNWGNNSNYQLADGTTVSRSVPVPSDALVTPAASCAASMTPTVAGGLGFTVAVKADGTVWAWGSSNASGLRGPNGFGFVPTQVAGLSGVKSVAAGYQYALALKGDGTVWAWGYNAYGQLGNGSTTNSATPVQVSGLSGVVEIAAGNVTAMALESDGSIWQWGNVNPEMQSGGSQTTPIRVQQGLFGVMAIAEGYGYAAAIRCDGTVWSWGYNAYGQLGNGVAVDSISAQRAFGLSGMTQVAVGSGGPGGLGSSSSNQYYGHEVALRSDGSVWAWGYNADGELGNGTTTSSGLPVQVSGLSGATGVAAGGYHGMAVKSDGTVWSWGKNDVGELGNGTTTNSSVPVQATGLSGATSVAAGDKHSLAQRSDGSNWNWGNNSNYQLADGTTTPSLVPERAGVARIGVGPPTGPIAAELLGSGDWIDMLRTYCSCGDPVNTATGNFSEAYADISVPGRGVPLTFVRTYNSLAASQNGRVGFGWTDSYNAFITFDSSGNAVVNEETGAQLRFNKSGSSYTPAPHVLASLVQNADATLTLTRRDKTQLRFSSTGQLQFEQDRNGYPTTMTYTGGQLASVIDPAGRSLTFGYSGNLITKVTDVAGARTINLQYDSSGNLTGVQDVAGDWTHFTYDPNHLLQTITDANGGATTNAYDGSGRVAQQTDPMNRVTMFDFSVPGKTKVTYPNGNMTLLEYQNDALVRKTDGFSSAQSASWSYTYDPNMFGVIQIIDANLHTTTQTWDSAGNLLTKTDALNRTTTYTYDSFNDVRTVQNPLGVTTTNSYDSQGNLTSSSTPLTGTSSAQTVRYGHADSTHPGDVTAMTDANGKVWTYAYDADGDRASVTDPMGNNTTYTYDAVGRLASQVSPKGNANGSNTAPYTSKFTYNAFGDRTSITDPLGHQSLHVYDSNGNLVQATDANNHTTINTYDLDNELIEVQRPDGSIVQTSYDSNRNLSSQTDGLNQLTSYGYDALDHRVTMTDPLNRITSYAYDGVANLMTMRDAEGQTTTYGYDVADQLSTITYSDGNTPNVNYTYDVDGQRKTMVDGTGTTSYSYDSLHRLTQLTNGSGNQVQYGYDLKSQLTSLTYPGGSNQVTRTYDDAGRLATVADWLTHTTKFQYDLNSNLNQITYPNSVVAAYGYDATNQLVSVTDTSGNNQFLNLAYTRDAANQLTGENSQGYGYDTVNRLTSGSGVVYTYDAADRITQQALSGGNTAILSYDAGNQLASRTVSNTGAQVSKLSYGYDANGNRTSLTDQNGAVTILSYDQANRLTTFGSGPTYVYNGDGLRVAKGSTRYTWDTAEGMPLLIQEGSTSYITGPGGLPLEQISGSAVYYYHQDQLGSTRAITDSTGTTQAAYTFDAYGNVSASTGTLANPFQYAGQYRDQESGLYYLRARYYEPGNGQFITRDPLVVKTRQPYQYVADAPVNETDPSGAFVQILIGAAVGGIIAGASSVIVQYANTGQVDMRQVGISAAAGAVGGAITAALGPEAGVPAFEAVETELLAGAAGGAAYGALNSIGNQTLLQHRPVQCLNWSEIANETLFGTVGGMMGSIGGRFLTNTAGRAFGNSSFMKTISDYDVYKTAPWALGSGSWLDWYRSQGASSGGG